MGDGFDEAGAVGAAQVHQVRKMLRRDARQQRFAQPRLVLLADHELACTFVLLVISNTIRLNAEAGWPACARQ